MIEAIIFVEVSVVVAVIAVVASVAAVEVVVVVAVVAVVAVDSVIAAAAVVGVGVAACSGGRQQDSRNSRVVGVTEVAGFAGVAA